MKIINPQLSGSVYASGSFVLPSGRADQRPTSPPSGSLFFEISDSGSNLVIYNGSGSNGWEIVGKQTTPSALVALNTDMEYLLVAGGAAGGGSQSWGAGGGGAGGYLSSSLASVTSGSTFTVTIGGGGGAVTNAVGTSGTNSTIAGATISTITATGGGGGGGQNSSKTDGANGGSGGGAQGAEIYATPGSGTVGQGNDGGPGADGQVEYTAGGGGGGATTAGQDASDYADKSGGNGGTGATSNITGTSVERAGGGGGGTNNGSGGSGNGGTATGGGGAGGTGFGSTNGADGTAGTANTGGGGGGAGHGTGAAGGSGVAIFAYDSGSFNCAGGIVGDAGNGRKYNQFNSSGTFKVSSTSDFKIVTGSNLVLHLDAGDFASRGISTWTDLSTNGVNQTVTGATLGQNFYYNFDGSNDSIAVNQNGASPDSNVSHTGYGNFTGAYNNPYTFEFWIKTTDSGGNNIFGQPIVGRDDGDLYGQISVRGGKLSFALYDGSWGYQESTTSINDGNWHHCVVVHYANQTVDLYVDNTKEVDAASLTLSVTRRLKMTTLMAGYMGEYIAGDLAQFRLYDTTLTSAEVFQNYNATKTNFV